MAKRIAPPKAAIGEMTGYQKSPSSKPTLKETGIDKNLADRARAAAMSISTASRSSTSTSSAVIKRTNGFGVIQAEQLGEIQRRAGFGVKWCSTNTTGCG